MLPIRDILTGMIGVLVFLPASFVVGEICSRGANLEKSIARGVIFIGIGYGFFAYLAVLLGYINLLRPLPLLVCVFLVLAARPRALNDFFAWARELIGFIFKPESRFERFCLLAFAATVCVAFLGCLLPEIGGDALAHHLNLPKRYAAMGRIATMTYDLKSYQSLTVNALYTIAMIFKSVALAKLFHWMSGLLLVFVMVIWIYEITGKRQMAVFWALMFWLTPAVINQMSNTYVDVGITFFVTLSLFTFYRAAKSKNLGMFVISGLFAGYAAASKHSGLLSFLPLGILAFAYLVVSESKKRGVKAVAGLLIGILIGCGFPFLRNSILTGNPVYPVFSSHGSIMTEKLLNLGLPKSNPLNFMLIHLFIIVSPAADHLLQLFQRFGFFSGVAGLSLDRSHWLGPFYVIALAGVLFSLRRKQAWLDFAAVILYLAGWFAMGQTERYLLPILPFMFLISAVGLSGLKISRELTRLLKSIGIFLVVGLLILATYHYRGQLMAVIRGMNEDAYLTKMERTYPIAKWANEHLNRDKKILSVGEYRFFYFENVVIRGRVFTEIERTKMGAESDKIIALLKKAGIGYVMVSEKAGRADLESVFDKMAGNPGLTRHLVTIDSENIREERERYSLYELL